MKKYLLAGITLALISSQVVAEPHMRDERITLSPGTTGNVTHHKHNKSDNCAFGSTLKTKIKDVKTRVNNRFNLRGEHNLWIQNNDHYSHAYEIKLHLQIDKFTNDYVGWVDLKPGEYYEEDFNTIVEGAILTKKGEYKSSGFIAITHPSSDWKDAPGYGKVIVE